MIEIMKISHKTEIGTEFKRMKSKMKMKTTLEE